MISDTDYSVSYLILSASVITDRHSRPFLNAFALVQVT